MHKTPKIVLVFKILGDGLSIPTDIDQKKPAGLVPLLAYSSQSSSQFQCVYWVNHAQQQGFRSHIYDVFPLHTILGA